MGSAKREKWVWVGTIFPKRGTYFRVQIRDGSEHKGSEPLYWDSRRMQSDTSKLIQCI